MKKEKKRGGEGRGVCLKLHFMLRFDKYVNNVTDLMAE